MLFFDLVLRRALIKALFWTSILIQSRKSQNVLNFGGYVFKNPRIYIYVYIVRKVGGRDYEQLIASFHLGSPPYSPFGAVVHQGFLRK